MVNLSYYIICFIGLITGCLINVVIALISKRELIASPSSVPSFPCNKSKRWKKIKQWILLFINDIKHLHFNVWLFVFVDLITLIIFALVYRLYGFSIQGCIAILLLCLLIIVAFVDFNTMVIPDYLSFMIGISGIIFILMGWTVTLWQGLLGLVIGGGSLWLLSKLSWLIFKKEGMGGGDIKLMAACGLYLGAGKTFFALVVTSYVALIILVGLLMFKKLKKNQYLPFGPFLTLGIAVTVLFYEDFMRLYWKLILG